MTMGPIPSISNLVQRRAVANRAGRARMGPHAPRVPWAQRRQGAPTARLIPYGARPAQDGHEARVDVVIVAHVLVLLLAPHQLCAWVLLCLSLDQVEGERRDLGQAGRQQSTPGEGSSLSTPGEAEPCPSRACLPKLGGR